MSTAKDDESHLEKEDDSPSLRRELHLIDDAPPFYTDKHIHYIATLAEKLERSYEGALTNHLKLSGVYWSVCSLMILCNNDLQQVDQYLGLVTRNIPNKLSIVEWIHGCFDDTTGAYGGDTGQDGHILYTLSALQILAMCDQLDQAPTDKIVAFIASLQQPDGSFVGDAAGEVGGVPSPQPSAILHDCRGLLRCCQSRELATSGCLRARRAPVHPFSATPRSSQSQTPL